MHFEKSLRRAIYPPWKDQYIDYTKLKNLLHGDGSEDGSNNDDEDKWTDEDEGAFVEELVNVQLEKVHSFQSSTIQTLKDRTSACESKLEPIVIQRNEKEEKQEELEVGDDTRNALDQILKELDGITKEMNELEKFSRINYTGFLKATKKHDRRRGQSYRVRPLMQVRLAALPFNKEDYSPLLFRLSTMYLFVRQQLDGTDRNRTSSESKTGRESYTAHKFWVHPENLLELKTTILRRLPVLIYNPQSSKVADGSQPDPTITSIYFDNHNFSLYNNKVAHGSKAESLRLRWYDQLSLNPEIFVEKKTVSTDDVSEEIKFTTKPKYIQPFLAGEYKMDKDVQRLKDRVGASSDQVKRLQDNVEEIQKFIKDNQLQPVLRANYARSAFQIPGDNRIRITLDTDVALIREDALDPERPCRDPEDWHRRDIDDADMQYPFDKIRKGEINRFPYALLEIRTQGAKQHEWVTELMSSHLVKPTPRFSKFVQGVAQLFDDAVNAFPFWLGEVGTDIRRDPQHAFDEEQERKAKAAEDEFAVGSMLRKPSSLPFRADVRSPVGSPTSQSIRSSTTVKATADMTRRPARVARSDKSGQSATIEEEDSDDDIAPMASDAPPAGLRQYLPSFSMSKYAQSRRQGRDKLPPGVQEPAFWIKDEGPVKVEAKVWLANQRTFVKWQHVSILLASLSMGLYNAAGVDNNVARALAVVYTVIALFTGVWGWGIYMYRSKLIRERSGKDFDNAFGPLVVCVGLLVALCLNFGFKYSAAKERRRGEEGVAVGNWSAGWDEL